MRLDVIGQSLKSTSSSSITSSTHSYTPNTASEVIQLGLVGLLTRPVLKAVFPSEQVVSTQLDKETQPTSSTSPASSPSPVYPTTPTTPSVSASLPEASAPAASSKSLSDPTAAAKTVSHAHQSVYPLGAALEYNPVPVSVSRQLDHFEPVHQTQPEQPAQTPVDTTPSYLPALYHTNGVHPIEMTAIAPPIAQDPSEDINHHTNIHSVDDEPDHDHVLAEKAKAMSLHERPASRATTRTNRTNRTAAKNTGEYVNGAEYAGDDVNGHEGLNHNDGYQNEEGILQNSTHNADPSILQSDSRYDDEEPAQRPPLRDTPSRSYVHPIPIVTTYEPDLPDSSVNRRRSVAGSTKAPSVKAHSVRAPTVHDDAAVAPAQSTRAPSVRAPTVHDDFVAEPTQGNRAPSVKRSNSRAGSVRSNKAGTGAVYGGEHRRAPSVAGSARHLPQLSEDEGRNTAGVGAGFAVGEIASEQRQRDLQHTNGSGRHSLQDQGSIPRDRSTTFSEPRRATSPRPHSSFGHRPQPNLLSITENERPESRADGGGNLGRSNTVLSRAGTLGRNGTLSRAANGGTVGSRRGAFGRGAGASIGTQPEEVLGRDDIHTRAELSERILDESTLRRLSTMEKKDARRLAKVIKTEAKSETAAVRGSIKELERLVKLQRQAASTERKSQSRLAKWTSKEHRARLRFLKEKERYERIEGELRNAENDYEERRDHAAGLTAQVAEKTQDLDDLRAQKAADDREREVKLLALKNPAHS